MPLSIASRPRPSSRLLTASARHIVPTKAAATVNRLILAKRPLRSANGKSPITQAHHARAAPVNGRATLPPPELEARDSFKRASGAGGIRRRSRSLVQCRI